MTTIVLAGNSQYSTLTIANGDTIDCNGFRLTIDTQPAETSISVITPGKAGKITVSGAYDLSTWSVTAGTSSFIDGTLPAGAILGAANGGTGSNSFGVNRNNGTITTVTGGTGQGAYGCNNNYGHVVNAIGGAGFLTLSNGVNLNYGKITNATGGSGRFAHGVYRNYGNVTLATGGTASPDAYGINDNHGNCLQATNGNSLAIKYTYGDHKLVDGDNFATTISDLFGTITTIYSIGTLNANAVIPAGVSVVELSAGGSSGGFTGIRGVSGRLGT